MAAVGVGAQGRGLSIAVQVTCTLHIVAQSCKAGTGSLSSTPGRISIRDPWFRAYGFTSSSTEWTLKLNIRSFIRRSISLSAPTKRMK